jgi:GxxExxY protein
MNTDFSNIMTTETRTEPESLKHRHITETIIGAFYEVYNELGHGFLESVYREALACELASKALRAEREKMVKVEFRNQTVGVFRTDLVIEDAVIVELKCARTIDRMHEAQLLNYLKATDYEVGLLLNFGYRPQFRRMFLSNLQKRTRGYPAALEAEGISPVTK